MALLSRGAILLAKPREIDVEVPEWGGSVRLRALTTRQRVELLDAILLNEREVAAFTADQALPDGERAGVTEAKPLDHAIAAIIWCAVDDAGKRLFTLADHDALADLPYQTLSALWVAQRELNDFKSYETADALKKSSE